MNNKGQAVMSEYVMIFFVVVAGITAMTVFVQRSLQARIHDERNFMIDVVSNNSDVCDSNCLAAAGGNITYEYEPYYTRMLSDVYHNEEANAGAIPGSAQVIGAVYTNAINEATTSISSSTQLPPQCANGGC